MKSRNSKLMEIPTCYKLKGVIVHEGEDLQKGHYYSYLKRDLTIPYMSLT